MPDTVRSLLEEIIDYPVAADNAHAIKLQLLAAKALLKLAEKKERRAPASDEIGRGGGLARAESLSPERRREIAKLGAETRWKSRGKT